MHNFWSSNRLIYLYVHKIEKGFILLSKLAYNIYFLFDRPDYEHIVFCFNYYRYNGVLLFNISYIDLQMHCTCHLFIFLIFSYFK